MSDLTNTVQGSGVGLTKAQRDWLEHAGCYENTLGAPVRACSLSGYVAPLRRLLKRGLVVRLPHPDPKWRSNFKLLRLTDAGRAALKAVSP